MKIISRQPSIPGPDPGTDTPAQPGRNYGIDALRILSALFVILLHTLSFGGILKNAEAYSTNYLLGWGLQITVFCAVDCFALISGYGGYGATHRYSSLAVLWLHTIFYTLGITAIFAVFVPHSVGLSGVLQSLFPFSNGVYWYLTAYCFVFAVAPALNTLVKALDARAALRLCAMLLFLLCAVPLLCRKDLFYANGGHSAIWLAALYVIGACVKKFDTARYIRKRFCLAAFVLCVVLNFLIKLAADALAPRLLGKSLHPYLFIRDTTPAIALSALSLFLLFVRLQPGKLGRRLISRLAPLSFGSYLIHMHPLFCRFFLSNRLDAYATRSWPRMLLAILLTTLAIFCASVAIDALRLLLFKCLKLTQRLRNAEAWLRARFAAVLRNTPLQAADSRTASEAPAQKAEDAASKAV